MIRNILLIVLLLACVSVVAWLGMKKLPELRVVDPASSKEAKAKEIKHEMLRKRLERIGGERAAAFQRNFLGPIGEGLQRVVRRAAGKLKSIEKTYAERQKGGGEKLHNPEVLRALTREAEELFDAGRYDAAEKKLIEVVSHDPKNVTAYEHLGRVYLATKEYASARETFQFLARLSPRDASVLASLGEVAEAEENTVDAQKFYKAALDISPNNPKYIDFYICAVLNAGDVHEATSALEHLREVNPENQKIAEFEEAITELRKQKLGQ